MMQAISHRRIFKESILMPEAPVFSFLTGDMAKLQF